MRKRQVFTARLPTPPAKFSAYIAKQNQRHREQTDFIRDARALGGATGLIEAWWAAKPFIEIQFPKSETLYFRPVGNEETNEALKPR